MADKVQFPSSSEPAGDDAAFIYRPWITLRDGRRIYAKAYGKAAFKIPRRY
jgi:hypothetical protein